MVTCFGARLGCAVLFAADNAPFWQCVLHRVRLFLDSPFIPAISIFPNKQPQALSPHVAFEIVAGLNGRVWVKGEAPQDTIFVYNALKNSEHMTAAVSEAFVKQLMTKMPLG